MKYHRLGASNASVSMLGLGCWSFGGGKYWGAADQKEIERVVHAALDEGINYFDTAEAYNEGESERSLGLALRGRRSEAFIGTKVSTSHAAPEALAAHCRESLERLNTDYIDLYMLHWPINRTSIEHFSADPALAEDPPSIAETFSAMEKLRREGLIRHIGVSNHGVQQMLEMKAAGVRAAANELPYNLISRGIEEGILPYCEAEGIGVIAYMALQQGVLTDMYRDFDSIPPAQAHSRHFHFRRGGSFSRHGEDGAEKEIENLLKALRGMAADLGVDTGTLALAWAMFETRISCTLVGSRTVEKLKRNVEASEMKLPAEVRNRLTELSEPVLVKLGSNPDYYENRARSRIS